MHIAHASIQNIRNIRDVNFTPARQINLISGANGSGKTSLLEALHFLSSTRSFRTHELRHLVSQGEDTARTVAKVQTEHSLETGLSAMTLGIERHLDGHIKVRYGGKNLDAAELATLLPVQVFHSGTFELLDGSPNTRRQFLDWGCFHADPSFIKIWRNCKRALKQRNSLLKYGRIDPSELQTWDNEFIQFGEALNTQRAAYLATLAPEFEIIIADLLGDHDVSMRFFPGWDQKRDLRTLLTDNFSREIEQGYTLAGPQRADIRFRCEGTQASERLSRGQKKLVVSALKLAQAKVYKRMTQRSCLFLVDDLPAELDQSHIRYFCHYLTQGQHQCFITCIDASQLIHLFSPDVDLAHFHLHSGQLRPISQGETHE